MAALLEEVAAESAACKATAVILRDLNERDPELDPILADAGFTRAPSPTSMELTLSGMDWDTLVAGLSKKSRRHQREAVAPNDGAFSMEVFGRGGREVRQEEWEHLYSLYRNVQTKSLELNTFALPDSLFATALEHPEWEILALSLKEEARASSGIDSAGPHAFVLAQVGRSAYSPMVVGLDYQAVDAHGAYRQCIRQIVLRAQELGMERVLLGMGAELEKSRFGAKPMQ